MRKLSLLVCLAFAFFVASTVAQTAPGGDSQGTQSSSPSMQQPNQQPGMSQPDNTSPSQTDQGTSNPNRSNGERTLKGCVQSQGGSYVLETKKGKEVALTGQDVSAHVGHEIAVKGTFGNGNGMSSTSSGNASGSEKTFNVTSVKMISESCKVGRTNSGSGPGSSSGHTNSGDMGSTPQGGNSTPSGTGNNSQPPQ